MNLRIENVKLLVCTHAHADHYGQAATVIEKTGCELWMHPNHEHMTLAAQDPDAALERRIEVARQSGVPEAPLRAYQESRKGQGFGIAGIVEPARDLLPGVEVTTDLGSWKVVETPGHAPSHVCLYQEERRILLSGDHLLGRVSLYFDHGWTPDPAGEFLHSLGIVEDLDMRLCLSGHGRTFTDVQAHINANRLLVAERLEACLTVLDAPGSDHRLRRHPDHLRGRDHSGERELVALGDALLPAAPRGHRPRDTGSPGSRASRSAGASLRSLWSCASTRFSARATSPSSPSSSSRPRRPRASATSTRPSSGCGSWSRPTSR